jgi:hypothetical protein
MKIFAACAALLTISFFATTTDAQTTIARAPVMTSSAASQIQPTDPQILTINRRLLALEQGLAALKQSAARSTYTCSDNGHSVNGAGVSDDCQQYTCKAESGLCILYGQARSSNDCASGFSYDSGKCCRIGPDGHEYC